MEKGDIVGENVTTTKHGFESRWGHHCSSTAEGACQKAPERRLAVEVVVPLFEPRREGDSPQNQFSEYLAALGGGRAQKPLPITKLSHQDVLELS